MPRKAEIKLTANIQEFQQNIETAKKLLYGVGKSGLDPAFSKQLNDQIEKGLVDSIKKGEKKLISLQRHFKRLGEMGSSPNVMQAYLKATSTVVDNLDKAKKIAKEIENMKGPGSATRPAGGMGGIGRMITGGLATLGVGVGVGAAYQRMRVMAQERAGVAALTGGSQVNDQGGEMGFTPQERRQRALDVAKAIGRDVSSEDLDRIVGIGEKAERAFGVTSGQGAGLMGAGRRAGVDNQAKFMADSLGTAIASKLEGSRIGEYLDAMAQSLDSMSEGVTLDTASIRQFAGVLISTGGVFARDPRNAFRVIQGLNQAFTGGDRFQQAQAARAVMGAAGPGTTPAGVEIRRQLGLFGNITNPDTLAMIKAMPGGEAAANVLGTPSMDVRDKNGNIKQRGILGEMFEQARTGTKGQNAQERIGEIMERLNLRGESGVRVAAEVATKGRGALISPEEMEKATLTKAQWGNKLQERLNRTYQGTNKSMMDLATDIERLKDTLAENIAPKLADIVNALMGRKTQAGQKDQKSIYDEDAGFLEPLSDPFGKAAIMISSLRDLFTGKLRPQENSPTGGFNMIQDAEERTRTPAGKKNLADVLDFGKWAGALDKNTAALEKKGKKEDKKVKGELANTGMVVQ